jgi:periplasmic protein CpxP/Spy
MLKHIYCSISFSIFSMPIISWQSLSSFTATSVFLTSSSAGLTNSPSLFPTETKNRPLTSLVTNNSASITKTEQPQNFFQQLELTSEQQQKIKKIHQRYRRLIPKKRNNFAVLQQQLSNMMIGTESAELIRVKNRQLLKLDQELEVLSFECVLSTREILTPQQRQKFRELVESHSPQ